MRFDFAAVHAAEDASSAGDGTSPPVASGTSTFASPQSQASIATGGGGTRPDQRVGLFYVGETNQICGGIIGKPVNGRFCTKPAGTCGRRSHSNKVALKNGHWHITAGTDSAKATPSLLSGYVTRSEDIEACENELKTFEVWVAFFSAIMAQYVLVVDTNGETEDVVSIMASPTASQLSAAANDLKTPRNAVLGAAIKSVVQGVINLPKLETMEDLGFGSTDMLRDDRNWDTAVGSIIGEWSKVGSNFKKLKAMFESLGAEHTKLGEGVMHDIQEIEDKIRIIDNKILIIKEGIGRDECENGGQRTVWQAIGELLDATIGIDVLEDRMENVSREVNTIRATLPGKVELKDYEDTMKHLEKALVLLVDRIVVLEKGTSSASAGSQPGLYFQYQQENQGEDIENLRLRIVKLETSLREIRIQGSRRNEGGTQPSPFDARQRDRSAVGGDQSGSWDKANVSAGGSSPNVVPNYDTSSTSQESWEKILEHVQTEFKFIQAKVKSLETPHRGETVDHNGIRFSCVEDCALLLKTHNIDVGYFIDFFSALVGMGARGEDYDGKESSDERHSARRTGSTIKTNMLLAAMTSLRPAKLFAKGGKGTLVPISEGFGAIPSIDKWHGNGIDGLKASLTEELRSHIQGIIGSLPGNGPAVELARMLCYRVMNQWNDLVSAIERTHTKLVAVARFSEKAAWKLIGRYGVALFEAMRPYRAAAAQLENPETLDDQASLLWAVLQCHRVVDEFMVNFEGHPAIVREMSLFMLTERVDPVQFAAVVEHNKESARENAALVKRVKALEETQNTMKRQIDNLVNELKQMKKKT